MKIEWQKKAKDELQKQLTYCFHEFGYLTTLRFQEKIDKQVNLLKAFPYMGKIEPLLWGRCYEYRSWVVHEHFKLIYHIRDEVIYIANFWDVRREPQFLIQETK